MLTSVLLWSFSHLLVNGDLASVILFGSFLAYSVYDIVSASQRSALGPLGTPPGRLVGDIGANRRRAGALRAALVLGSSEVDRRTVAAVNTAPMMSRIGKEEP